MTYSTTGLPALQQGAQLVGIDEELGQACDFLAGVRQTFDHIRQQCPDDPFYLDTHVLHLSKYTDKCEELLQHLIYERRLRQQA
jgi:hypothetical protein